MAKKQKHQLQDGDVVKTSYSSRDVPIPLDFLVADPPDAADPIVIGKQIDWRATAIPEYADRYAVVIDNVLSPSECATLVRLAEESVILDSDSDSDDVDADGDYDDDEAQSRKTDRKKKQKKESEKKSSPWQPALVNIGHGMEAFDKLYRNSDRIIWDNQVVMDRLWARCARAEGLREALAVVDDELPQGSRRVGRQGVRKGMRWEFVRFNHRGRYLRYTGGQYFRPHCDGAYSEKNEETGEVLRTFYTVHLYLNDSFAERGGASSSSSEKPGPDDLVGGATTFLSHDEKRRVDVDPKAGRVLIFEHDGLYHCGDDVEQGVKLTMRTDIMYRLCRDSKN